jgi:hypothetical protein
MTRTIEVEIDEGGVARPVDPADSLPRGRALLVLQTEPGIEASLLSEGSLPINGLQLNENIQALRKGFIIADNGLPYFSPTGRKLTPEMIKAAQDGDFD